jgi:tetratricopeptide (TPR) repeat protein
MPTRRWYAVLLVVLIAAITLGAVFSIPSIRGWRVLGPFASRPAPEQPARAKLPTPTPAPKPVVPVAAPASAVAVVQAPIARPAHRRPAWTPSERQVMLDRVYLDGKENRIADAIATLEAWDAKHPNEPETLRELARLLVRDSRTDEAFARYRTLLAAGADSSVRAEYAAALLGAQHYDSAAANFRLLTAADSANVTYHLGLGRALAWSNHCSSRCCTCPAARTIPRRRTQRVG